MENDSYTSNKSTRPSNRIGSIIWTHTDLDSNSTDHSKLVYDTNKNTHDTQDHDDNLPLLHICGNNYTQRNDHLERLVDGKYDVTLQEEGFARLTQPSRSNLMPSTSKTSSSYDSTLSSCSSSSSSSSTNATCTLHKQLPSSFSSSFSSSSSYLSFTNSLISRSSTTTTPPLSSSPLSVTSTWQQLPSSSTVYRRHDDPSSLSSSPPSLSQSISVASSLAEDAASPLRILPPMTGTDSSSSSSSLLPTATTCATAATAVTVTVSKDETRQQDDGPETDVERREQQGSPALLLSMSACTGVSLHRDDRFRGMEEKEGGLLMAFDVDKDLDPVNPSHGALSIFPGDPYPSDLSTSSSSLLVSSCPPIGQLPETNNIIVGATIASLHNNIDAKSGTGPNIASNLRHICIGNNIQTEGGDKPGDNNSCTVGIIHPFTDNSPDPFLALALPRAPPCAQSTKSTSTGSSTTSTATTRCPTHPTASSFVQVPNLVPRQITSFSSTTVDDSASSLSSSSSSSSSSPQFTPAPLHLLHSLDPLQPHSPAFSLYPSPPPSDSSPPLSPPLCPSSSSSIVPTATFPAPPTASTTPPIHPLADKPSSLRGNPLLTELTAVSSSSPSWLHPFRKLKTVNTSTTFSSVSAANISSVSFISSNSIEPPTTKNSSVPSPPVSLPLRNSFFKHRIRSFSFSNDSVPTTTDSTSEDTSFLKRMVDLARNHTMPLPSGRRNSGSNSHTTSFAFATITLPKTLSNKSLDGYGHAVTDLPNLGSRTRSSSSSASASATTSTSTGASTIPLAPIISAIKRGNFLALSEPLLNVLLMSMAGKNSTALETINISGAAISAADAKLLARLIRSSEAANIKILKLARNAISQQALKYIFEAWKYNQTITVLSLARSGINDKTVKYISKVLAKNETIRELDLSSNRITAPGMEVLAEAIIYNRALVRFCIQSNNIKRAGAPFLARLLAKNRVLRHLNAGSNGLGPEGCVMIADAVRFNRTLNSLSLDMNEMGPQGATAMATALASNRHLTYLYLPHNNIGDQGLEDICESLKRNKSLIGLDLELNNIGAGQSLAGMKALGDVLKANHTLREINLAYNLFSGDAVSELMKGVAVNSTLESINFTNCGISTEGALAIAEVLPSARGLQNLGLTSNPDIAVEAYWALSNNLAKNRSMKGIQLDYNSEDRHVLYEAIQHLLTRNFIWQQAIYAAACRILVLSRVVLLGRPANQRLLQTQIQQQQQQPSPGKGAWSMLKKTVGLVRTNSSNSYSSLLTINNNKHRPSSPEIHSPGGASPLFLAVGNMSRVAPEVVVSQDDERESGPRSVQNLAHGNCPSSPASLVVPGPGLDVDRGLGLGFSRSSSSNSIRRDLHPLVLPHQQQQLMDQGLLLGSGATAVPGRPLSTPSASSSPTAYHPHQIVAEAYNAHKVLANLANMPYEIFETICAYLDPGHTMSIGQIRATIQVAGDRSTLAATGGYYTKDVMLERIFETRYISPFGMRYGTKNGDERA